ncbi:ABC transporter substrate-binding protein [Candidatus Leptofilum sp.]|uniref:ABC transporter substrate-binding protein n=1 Tax=Candidatus Leptofilum sp. TaxID=3241576 RepID=UPI003B59F6A4
MKQKLWLILSLAVALTILAACGGGAPEVITETVEVTRVITETVTEVIEGEEVQVEVTRVVTETIVEEVEAEGSLSEGEALRRKTVIFDIGGGRVANPESWNPYIPGAVEDMGFHQAVMEPLFILNYESGEIMPWLGESYDQNEAGDVWTITLREGIKWSDGEVMDADDVIFTINMLLENPDLDMAGDMVTWVESVEKVDDLTTQFNLTGPNPRFVLDHFAVKIYGRLNIVPEHIWADKDPLTFTNYDPDQGWPVFTGPYLLESVSETEFVYTRDDDWWGVDAGFQDLPAPERLVWTTFGTEDTKVAAMASDGLDSLMDISLGAFFALQQRNPNTIAYYNDLPYAWPDPCARNIELNLTVEPWNDPDMRKALNYAIDRDEVVAIAYEGATVASEFFFPAYSALDPYVSLIDTSPITTFDPEQAKAIIESKGYVLNDGTGYYEKDGVELAINIQTPEPLIENQKIAQVVVEQWQRIGINASAGNVAYGTFWDNFFNGNYDARSGWQTCGSINEPWASMDTLNDDYVVPVGERASKNAWRWENAEYSELVDQIGVLPLGDPQINDLFVQAAEIYMDELPVIPVTQAKKIIPFNTTYWTNWPSSDNPYIHPPTWWQSTHVIIHNLEPAQ